MTNEIVAKDNFKDEILEVIGEIPVSNTQKYRVLVIKDDFGTKISAQKWWRQDSNSEWKVGKGFKLDQEQSGVLGLLLTQASSKIA